MIALVSAVLIALGGAYVLLRPVRPKLSNQELADIIAQIGDNESITYEVVTDKLEDSEKEIIQRAFLKGPDLRWMYAGKNMDDIAEDADKVKSHEDLTFYLIGCMLTFMETYGTTIVARDSVTQKFLGSFSLIPPYKQEWLLIIHFLKSVVLMGLPVPIRQGKEQAARFDAYLKGYDKLEKEATSSRPHWTIEAVAVADDVQGRGIGRKLIRLAKAVGDLDGTPMYLVCHDENLPFYKKMGFTQKSRVSFQPKNIPDTTEFPYNGKTYTP